jgi:hypothetical protein
MSCTSDRHDSSLEPMLRRGLPQALEEIHRDRFNHSERVLG